MNHTVQLLITAGTIAGAVSVLAGLLFRVHRFLSRCEEQGRDVERMKEENALICFALSACLDGLLQLGANHTVPVAKEKLDRYLNRQAHK